MKRASWINVLGPIQGHKSLKSEKLAQLCSEREGDMTTEEWPDKCKIAGFEDGRSSPESGNGKDGLENLEKASLQERL